MGAAKDEPIWFFVEFRGSENLGGSGREYLALPSTDGTGILPWATWPASNPRRNATASPVFGEEPYLPGQQELLEAPATILEAVTQAVGLGRPCR